MYSYPKTEYVLKGVALQVEAYVPLEADVVYLTDEVTRRLEMKGFALEDADAEVVTDFGGTEVLKFVMRLWLDDYKGARPQKEVVKAFERASAGVPQPLGRLIIGTTEHYIAS